MKSCLTLACCAFALGSPLHVCEEVSVMSPPERVEMIPGPGKERNFCCDAISSEDMTVWMYGKEPGWYAAASLSSGSPASVTYDERANVLTLPHTEAEGGVCAGCKISTRKKQYTDMVFSFSLAPAEKAVDFTWSLWYENGRSRKSVLLNKGTVTATGERGKITCLVDGKKYREIRKWGNGSYFIVFGCRGGEPGQVTSVSDISLMLRKHSLHIPLWSQMAVILLLLIVLMFFYKKHREGLLFGRYN